MSEKKQSLTPLDIEALEWRILSACRKHQDVAAARAKIEKTYAHADMGDEFHAEVERIFAAVRWDERGFYLD